MLQYLVWISVPSVSGWFRKGYDDGSGSSVDMIDNESNENDTQKSEHVPGESTH